MGFGAKNVFRKKMSGKVWPCVLVNGLCGQQTWICRRWPMNEKDAAQWIEKQKKEHEESEQLLKGKFVAECVSHAGFMDYLRANPRIPLPRVWISNK